MTQEGENKERAQDPKPAGSGEAKSTPPEGGGADSLEAAEKGAAETKGPVFSPPSPLSPARLAETAALGLKNLARYKLRSLLTTLGIVFGIGAVVSMMSVTAGASEEILARIRKMGITNIIVSSEKPPEKTKAATQDRGWVKEYGIREKDARMLEESIPGSPRVIRGHKVLAKARLQAAQASPEVLGVEPEYFEALNLKIASGRTLSAADEGTLANVCVVGPSLFRALGGLGDPVGSDIKIDDEAFRICGVLEGPSESSETQQILMPYRTALRRFGTMQISQGSGTVEGVNVEVGKLVISCSDRSEVIPAASAVEHVLSRSHREQDYSITVPLKLLEQAEQTQKIFSVVMILIAAISLVVGGIGIANIMFASVMERTREIGIRRALGARQSDILIQFLMETVLIALSGGILGCALGVAGSMAVSKFTGWPVDLNPLHFALALVISAAVGVAAGMAPARRAARLDPVAAFRHE